MKAIVDWAWFVLVQLISLVATVLGWLVLIPFCLLRAWRPVRSTLDATRSIDEWAWRPLNLVFGNREDGVSGERALIWLNGTTQGPYMPNAWAPWRAYVWSGWRNSADGLKYLLAWKGGPFKRWEWRGYHVQFGWNGSGFPVISMGR